MTTDTMSTKTISLPYKILHNVWSDFWTTYAPGGGKLADGWSGVVEVEVAAGDDPVAVMKWGAEIVFGRHNRDNRPDGQLAPSLSVGDVVLMGETALAVALEGFEEVMLDRSDLAEMPYLEARDAYPRPER